MDSNHNAKSRIKLHVQLNYGRLILWAIDISTDQEIKRIEMFPAGVEWYSDIFQYLKEKHQIRCGRDSIERMLEALVIPKDHQDRTMLIKGRNTITGEPRGIEVNSIEIRETSTAFFSYLQLKLIMNFTITFAQFFDPTRRSMLYHIEGGGGIPAFCEDYAIHIEKIILESGDFPRVKGFDRWLENGFGAPVEEKS